MSECSNPGDRRVPRLLLVTPPDVSWGDAFREALTAALAGGVDTVLVRMPAATAHQVWALARSAKPLVVAAGARLLIHDRVDVAQALDADGVHLARRSLPVAAVRSVFRRATIGFSAHSEAEVAQAASDGADYVTISPVYPSTSKADVAPLGAERAQSWSLRAPLPVLWLGGVRFDRLAAAGPRPAGGVHGVAAIEAFSDAASAGAEARQIRAWLAAEPLAQSR